MHQDLDLPPIMEEEEIQSAPVNEERAIVLFQPLQHHHQPSTGQIFVDRNLISGFKSNFFQLSFLYFLSVFTILGRWLTFKFCFRGGLWDAIVRLVGGILWDWIGVIRIRIWISSEYFRDKPMSLWKS